MECPSMKQFLTICVIFALFELPIICEAFSDLQNCDPLNFTKWRLSHCAYRDQCKQGRETTNKVGLNGLERIGIVHAVNMLRDFVASGSSPQLPGATNMKQMVWSDDMAELSLRLYDQQCRTPNEHLLDRNLKLNERFFLNKLEFTASTKSNELLPVEDLFVETIFESTVCGCEIDVTNFKPGQRQPYDDLAQILWAESHMIGCSRIRYLHEIGYDRFFVCFFGPGFSPSTTAKSIRIPIYEVGTPECPKPSQVYPSLCANEATINTTHPCLDQNFRVAYPRLCNDSTYNITCNHIGAAKMDLSGITLTTWILAWTGNGVLLILVIGLIVYFRDDIKDRIKC